jgi:hypothetical protein
MFNDSASTSPDARQEAAPFDWLLALLREAMVGVMADDQPPLKKANALARLGSLYLKTYNAAELKRANAELEERAAELEERLAALGVESAAGEAAAGQTAPEAGWRPPGPASSPRVRLGSLPPASSKARSPGNTSSADRLLTWGSR